MVNSGVTPTLVRTMPREPLPPSSSGEESNGDETELEELEQALVEVQRSLQQLQQRYQQVRRDRQQQAQLQQHRQQIRRELRRSGNRQVLRAELRQINEQLETLELNLESRLFSWKSMREPFWQAVRFGGLGIVLGWILNSCAG